MDQHPTSPEPRTYRVKETYLQAVQLIPAGEPGSNAAEIALWCGGNPHWTYDDKRVYVSWVELNNVDIRGGQDRLVESSWLVRHADGGYEVFTDEIFVKVFDR